MTDKTSNYMGFFSAGFTMVHTRIYNIMRRLVGREVMLFVESLVKRYQTQGLVRCSMAISFVSGSFGPVLYFGVLLL